MALLGSLSPSNLQRVLGLAAGVSVAAYAYVSTQRMVWRNAAEVCSKYGYKPQESGPEDDQLWGPRTRALIIQSWNRTIDNTLGSLAAELARRGL